MKLVIGGDHAGFPLKQKVIKQLKAWGHEVHDVGCYSEEPVDFPDISEKLCNEVRAGHADRGIMCCGTGVGASIAANKFPGIRAALCHDVFCAHQSVEHDDANVICMGHWIIGEKLAYDILEAYLNAQHSESQEFRRRVAKLGDIENRLLS